MGWGGSWHNGWRQGDGRGGKDGGKSSGKGNWQAKPSPMPSALEQVRRAVQEHNELLQLSAFFAQQQPPQQQPQGHGTAPLFPGPTMPAAGMPTWTLDGGAVAHTGLLPTGARPQMMGPMMGQSAAPPMQGAQPQAEPEPAVDIREAGFLRRLSAALTGRSARPQAGEATMEQLAAEVAALRRESQELRQENARLRGRRDRRSSSPARSRTSRTRTRPARRSTSPSPEDVPSSMSPTPRRYRADRPRSPRSKDLERMVRRALARSVAEDARGEERRTASARNVSLGSAKLPAVGEASRRTESPKEDDVEDDDDDTVISPAAHMSFFRWLGSRSTIKEPLPVDVWMRSVAKKWSQEDWKAKLRKRGMKHNPEAKEPMIAAALAMWRQATPGARIRTGTAEE